MTSSLEIFRHLYCDRHTEVGNGYNNYASIILQKLKEGACERTTEYYHKALGIFAPNGPEFYKTSRGEASLAISNPRSIR